jgi:hypothetical protein
VELAVFGHSGFDHIGSRVPTNLPSTAVTAPSSSHRTIINNQQQLRGEETMNKLYYPTPTRLHVRDGRPTDFDQSQGDVSDRLDHSSHHLPTSASAGPSLDESTRGREKARSTAGVIITRLLAVLVVVMVATSILGFTLFDRQGGNSATALVSLVIGGLAAVLGLITGFRKAHQVS